VEKKKDHEKMGGENKGAEYSTGKEESRNKVEPFKNKYEGSPPHMRRVEIVCRKKVKGRDARIASSGGKRGGKGGKSFTAGRD